MTSEDRDWSAEAEAAEQAWDREVAEEEIRLGEILAIEDPITRNLQLGILKAQRTLGLL